jgi:hypothetical protein
MFSLKNEEGKKWQREGGMNSSSSSAGDLEDDSGEIAPRDAILAISSLRQNIGVALYTTTKNAIYTAEISGSSATLSARLEEILLTTPPKLVLTNNSTANNLSLISFLTSDGDADHEVCPKNLMPLTTLS